MLGDTGVVVVVVGGGGAHRAHSFIFDIVLNGSQIYKRLKEVFRESASSGNF